MENPELNRIIENFEDVFRGDAWHGPSILETLSGINPSATHEVKAFSKYSIAQHVCHITAFRRFLIEKLQGNFEYEVKDDWGNETPATWAQMLQDLKDSQTQIIKLLNEATDDLLLKTVPGCDYHFYKLIQGVIQHDVYHLGMIWVLWE